MHNSKRNRKQASVTASAEVPASAAVEAKPTAQIAAPSAAAGYDVKMVEHVRMMTSLLEGREVSTREVLEMLARENKKQHSINRKEKSEYRDCELNENSS
jgi:hypothetical protein